MRKRLHSNSRSWRCFIKYVFIFFMLGIWLSVIIHLSKGNASNIQSYHSVENYWNRFDYTYQLEDVPRVLVALTLHDQPEDAFYIDYGATTHMTNDAGKLTTISPYQQDMIYVGNGEALPITHTGNALLMIMVQLNWRMYLLLQN